MDSSESKAIWQTKDISNYKTLAIVIAIFLLYLGLRILAWENTVLLEDTDSLFYIHSINTFLTFNLQEISNLNPDSTPFYPFLSAICALPGWSSEFAARLCSLLFSLILFIAIFLVAKRTKDFLTIVFTLIILTFSSQLISLSFSVLTEPSYIATIYLGYWFFLSQYENPRIWKAALLGIVFALSFLNRTEGILYLVLIPFLQGLHLLFSKKKSYDIKRWLKWTIVFGICFSGFIAPQVYQVSKKMGSLAINGRQAWRLLDHNLTGMSNLDEKIFGLNFSPSQTNITYARRNYSILKKQLSQAEVNNKDTFKRTYRNINHFNRKSLIQILGPLGLILCAFGVFYNYQEGRKFETNLHLIFISANLILPLSHANYLLIRHVLVIVPMLCIFEASGIAYLTKSLLHSKECSARAGVVIPFVIFAFLLIDSARDIRKTFRTRHYNSEYSLTELEEPLQLVKSIARDGSGNFPVIAAQRGYLSYFAGARQEYLPYCDYDKFVNWCSLNGIDFLYLKHSRLHKYPWFKVFLQENPPPDFDLIYRGLDAGGKTIELYLVKGNIDEQ